MENKQTAVDWLFKDQNLDDFDIIMLYQIAKQMEKEQLENAWEIGSYSLLENSNGLDFEEYYNQTYERKS